MAAIEVHAGDFVKGKHHSLSLGALVMVGIADNATKYYAGSHIEEIAVASEENVKKLGGTVGWGVVGGTILGPVGLLAGLLLGGQKKQVTFVCKFDDGKKFLGTTNSKTYTEILALTF